MSVVIKSLLLTATFAICGLAVHQVTTDTTAVGSAMIASGFTDLSEIPAAASTHVPDHSSGETRPDYFRELKEHLAAAREAAAALPGYTAILEMQEEVDGDLRPVGLIEFKTRRQPFSVYMRWTESEQEALYVDGENDNRLIVKPTKGLAAIRRVWRLDPDCKMAKQTCRYPITDVGIENLIIRIQEFYDQQEGIQSLADCRMERSKFSDQDVVIFDIKFKHSATVPA